MSKAILHFINKNNQDDILRIFDDDKYVDMYRVTFKAHDAPGVSEMFLSYHDLQDYISTILKSLERDNDPFEYVQVITPVHPSVIYHVCELEDRETRWHVEDMVFLACRKQIWNRGAKRNIQTRTH